ncbi:hypothetical protein P154DRAFT_521183 [Amniculicola lignicola CBS 123094]|uniref:Transposase Tc1-like domain-containing protein n=1 Tax=Amniculicola lignicola CBS 123094 TaxID=1392246 RepID=A0A6A5WJI2_9PLEO|nr:hypothetical protein P154DRAFT_521183 [Amniculicola lignicola CBS 123094]
MAQINRRKPYKYKVHKERRYKTPRRELNPIQRAFAVGATTHGNASQRSTAALLGVEQGTISKLITRTKERAETSGLPLDDPQLYKDNMGRGRPELLTQAQKDEIIRITMQDCRYREQESKLAVNKGNFKGVMESISVSLFENVMYEAGYSRRKPGFRPPLTAAEKKKRFEWALAHNPNKDEEGDNKGFNFRRVVYTDETPARAGDQWGMKRAWCREGEEYHKDVKREKIRPACTLQFWGAFTYGEKGPCHIYRKEIKEMAIQAKKDLDKENVTRHQDREVKVAVARQVLWLMGDPDVNSRSKAWRKDLEYTCGDRTRGGVDGFRHREEVLKPLIKPWMDELKKKGKEPLLLEDGAPAHTSRIASDYLSVHYIEKLPWLGHSPDDCRRHWFTEWEALPQEQIDRWIDNVLNIVRRILKSEGDNDFHG